MSPDTRRALAFVAVAWFAWIMRRHCCGASSFRLGGAPGSSGDTAI
jgi:hypothetical protein